MDREHDDAQDGDRGSDAEHGEREVAAHRPRAPIRGQDVVDLLLPVVLGVLADLLIGPQDATGDPRAVGSDVVVPAVNQGAT
jgi:hypothetical protein